MSFLGFGAKDGMHCEDETDESGNPTGNLICRKFKASKNAKLGTGSEATISVDPQTCKASFVGRFSVLEEDEEDFERIAKKRESACKSGIV